MNLQAAQPSMGPQYLMIIGLLVVPILAVYWVNRITKPRPVVITPVAKPRRKYGARHYCEAHVELRRPSEMVVIVSSADCQACPKEKK